ncbi:MAG: hypothetical protein Q9181_005232 [Wetmoreana brouardii]
MEFQPILWAYSLIQWFLDKLLSPIPPPPKATLGRPRIAVIGAGLTGVSSASHCVGHGFDVTIFEAGDEKSIGGIWSRVNNTSGLQIHSIMYRFHPSVKWSAGYPDRQQIVSQITQLWKRYGLQERTKFNTRVTSAKQDNRGCWVINNDPSLGHFDGILAAVGTCGDPKVPHLPNQEAFKGEIYHSSRLDGKTAAGKKILIIGGGASAVEALEFVVHTDAASTYVLARSDKWIIPRNAFVDGLLALNIFGQETIFSWIPESLLRKFFYRDLEDLAPGSEGLFTETPMVNSDIFHQIRDHKAEWLRGDIVAFTDNGIRFRRRATGVPKGGPGQEIEVKGDMVIMATGYQRPSLSFLPDEVFKEPYQPPKSFRLNGSLTARPRIARPQEYWMKRWIDMTSYLKARAPTGAFDFFTYSELIYWFIFCVAINPFRWKWAPFVFLGIGSALPKHIVYREDQIRNGLGMKKRHGE